ncbi:type IV pilin protein [Bergeriella denitrificans]|uniref:Pilin n=1 Tax=Bergeriella denitrificans TaxID=494 RepID=A0A378UKC9_BERDE|nr:type IV pilin protein [Bergeriella denitrificans]STZ76941.1 pilin [Bergeriella denitrificans]
MNPRPPRRHRGFTLIQLLAALAVLAALAAAALPAYNRHLREGRLREAQAALLENAQFLEKHYRQTGSIRANSTTWPTLPVTEAGGFCIRLSGLARGQSNQTEGKFTLKAVALDKTREPRVLKTNEALMTTICESSSSSCDDGLQHFSGDGSTDQDCRVYQH